MKKAIQFSVLSVLTIIIMTACNFGDDLPTPSVDYTVVSNEDARPLPDDFTTRKSISYSGYRDGQFPGGDENKNEIPSESEILEDLNILNAMGFSLLRLYDTGIHAARVLNVIKSNSLDMKVMLGVWISGPKSTYNGKNTEACDQAVEWATGAYKDQIVAVSVGNECMVDWNTFGWATPPADIAYYVSYVRDQITQPVTVDDNWEPWSLENEDGTAAYSDVYMVAEAVDFIALHTYAIADAQWNLWNYKQTSVAEADRADAMMDAAVDFAKENYTAAKDALANLGITKPIIIGETGWKSTADAMGIAHPVNQQMYYEKMEAWVGTTGAPVTSFYFEAFDEPWKGGDDNWGFFNVDREAKYIVYSNPTWKDNNAIYTVIDGDPNWTSDDAVYYMPPEAPIPIGDGINNNDSIFYVYADDVTAGYDGQLWDMDKDGTPEADNLMWESWDGGKTGSVAIDSSSSNSTDPTDCAIITPVEAPAWGGWGMMALMQRQGFDLSAFSSGSLVFKIKTQYTGEIMFGIQTGHSNDNDSWDLLVTVNSGNPSANYGYDNDNTWREVSIPIQDLVDAAVLSFENDPTSSANLAKVFIPFVVAHKSTTDATEIWVDQIRWTK